MSLFRRCLVIFISIGWIVPLTFAFWPLALSDERWDGSLHPMIRPDRLFYFSMLWLAAVVAGWIWRLTAAVNAPARRLLVRTSLLLPLVGICIYAAWFLGVGTPVMFNLPRPFQSAIWKTHDGFNTKVRCSMIADLRHRVDLVGKSSADIIELLGPDQTHDIFPYERSSYAQPKTYVLCPSPIDWYVLTLEWRNGRVAKTEVWQT